jgi:hypothetical protein
MRKLLIRSALAVALLGSALVGPATVRAAVPAAPAAGLWTEPASTSVFQDSQPSKESGQAVRLDTGTNEYESAQIVIRPDAGLAVTAVAFTSLSNGGSAIAASNLRYNFVTYQKLNANSPIYPPTRKAPADFPDNLSNLTRISVPRGITQSIWITAHVPKGTPAGHYTGAATVRTDKGDLPQVPIAVDVRAVQVPDAADGVFNNSMWNTFNGELSWKPDGNTIERIYGYPRFTDKWWALMENVAAQMKEHRTNNVTLPLVGMLLDGGSTVDTAGRYSFNWSKYDQVVQFFIDRGVMKRLEGFWVCADTDNWRVNHQDGVREVEIISRRTGTSSRDYAPWNSSESTNFIDQFIPALKQHLESKQLPDGRSWADVYWMHVGDEPGSDADRTAWHGIADRMHSHWPNVKLGDAVVHEPNGHVLAESMGVMVPNLLNYPDYASDYDALRAQGRELWFYNCNVPLGNSLNRFIDQPQWNQRLTIWYAYSRQATGYLHYSMSGWLATLDSDPVKGDHYIVWPDVPNNKIQSTIRYESLRDGIEDYEILAILGRTNPGLARNLAYALVQDPDTYSPDTGYMARVRRMMLDAAAGKPVVASDLARNASASASSQSTDGPAANAVDGNAATAWKPATGSGTQTWQVNLGRQVQVDGVRLNWGTTFGTSYKIQLSYDGTRWSDAAPMSGDGGDDFVGINGKAQYVRLSVSAGSGGTTPYALNSFEIGGAALAEKNLLGGRTYRITDPAGNVIVPSDKPDSGIESTDGVLADDWGDGRTYGFGPGQTTANVTVDLGSAQTVDGARIHAYEEYPAYRPDRVQVSVSSDGQNYTSLGNLTATNDQSRIWYNFDFSPVAARYVRLTFSKSYSQDASAMLIDEIEAYGS